MGVRTDLASEAVAEKAGLPGIRVSQEHPQEGIMVTRVFIDTDEAAKELGKGVGAFVTIDAPRLTENDPAYRERVEQVLQTELSGLISGLKKGDTVLIIGLGNRTIMPDALGPAVVDKVVVSRHVTQYLPDLVDERVRPVCAIAPGVLGVTGIETGEVVLGLVEKVKPALVIAIDALASRSTDKISTSVQLTDTGVQPGSGMGTGRMQLTRETLGVPVIALGVPTVVHASTISQDAVSLLLNEMGEKEENGSQLVELVGKVVSEKIGPLVVTPKDIDCIIDRSAELLASGIDMALHNIGQEELRRFLH
jgi:spore protease